MNPSPLANIPPVVKNLLIINVIFYIASQLFNGIFYQWFSAFYYESPNFKIWQPITYMFMHDPNSLLHIFFNMFALYMFGSTIERLLGSKRFLNFYLLTGLGALLLQYAVQNVELYQVTGQWLNRGLFDSFIEINGDSYNYNTQGVGKEEATAIVRTYQSTMVGASGAVFGLLIAFGMLFPNVELMLMFIPVPIKAKYFIPFYILAELFLGVAKFQGDSIAHFAHLGGALFGFILIKLWGIRRPGGFI